MSVVVVGKDYPVVIASFQLKLSIGSFSLVNPSRYNLLDLSDNTIAHFLFSASGDNFIGLTFRNTADEVVATVTGISVDADTLTDALDSAPPEQIYQTMVGLLDDDTTFTGSTGADMIETGAGNDTVEGRGGNDTALKWKAGNYSYDGGGGVDSLSFNTALGVIYPTAKVQQLVIDLSDTSGTNGLNPYGGTLTLRNLERIVGTDAPGGDRLTGDDKANAFGDGIYDIGGDRIRAKGGNDRVELAEGLVTNHGGFDADGGTGIDTLAVNVGLGQIVGPHRLDLSDQSKNSGVFGDGIFKSFDVFVPGGGFFGGAGQTFIFQDSKDGHVSVVEAMMATNRLRLAGGNDTAILSTALPVPSVDADGGGGSDTLRFEVSIFFADNRLDLASPAKNSGVFAGGTFKGFEVFEHVEADSSFAFTQKFTFVGTDAGERVTGAYGIDVLNGRGGGDVLGGGEGNDRITLGAGKDAVVFDAAIGGKTAALANVDAVTDFRPGEDRIHLDNAVFKGIGKAGAALDAARFVIGGAAKDASDRLVYNKTNGKLSHDKDGKGGDKAILFATLDKNLDLKAGDFLVV